MKCTKEERLDIIIRSGKVIGDNVNIGANTLVIHDIACDSYFTIMFEKKK